MIKTRYYCDSVIGKCGNSYKLAETEEPEKDGWLGAWIDGPVITVASFAYKSSWPKDTKHFCSWECFAKWAEAILDPVPVEEESA